MLRFDCVGNHLTDFLSEVIRVIVMDQKSFFHECYEILSTERPLLLMEVADLVASGSTPREVNAHVFRLIQNPESSIPALAENTAHYLIGLVPVIPSSTKPPIH